jgi:ubiquinone/menaquinone biosynthesis C-methylase UbiE
MLLIGGFSTYIHLQNSSADLPSIFKLNVNLLFAVAFITIGLAVRFFKWHFFLRLYDIKIRIRKSISIFFASLFVNLFFPLLIGETLTKNYFMHKENYKNSYKNISVILAERLLDVIAILIIGVFFLFFSSDKALINSPSSYLFIGIGISVFLITFFLLAFRLSISVKFLTSFVIGIAGWIIIYLMYFTMPENITAKISFADFGYIFSNYLIFYPATPMGIFLSGNYLYSTFGEFVKDPVVLAQTVINIRIASIAPSLIIGLGAFVNLLRKQKRSKEFHFDEISEEYEEMIPVHVRDRLITRKCDMMVEDLKSTFGRIDNLVGLDLGGGKGWYSSRLIDLTGGKIILVEKSVNQAQDAVKRDSRINSVVASIDELPFEDNYADFAFSINVFHHLDDKKSQEAAFLAASRVLKPGGKFYLHEINVHNIFFKIYMNYFFPLVKTIDEGIENWIEPTISRFGNLVSNKVIYFTFLPEFVSKKAMEILEPVEKRMEDSRLKKYSAHYFRVFENIK